MTTTNYPADTATQLAIAEREAEGAGRLVCWEPGDDSDEAFEARLADCLSRDDAARVEL